MLARYDGRCGCCDQEIREGVDEIVELEGEWVHAACADDWLEDDE